MEINEDTNPLELGVAIKTEPEPMLGVVTGTESEPVPVATGTKPGLVPEPESELPLLLNGIPAS